MRVFVAATSNPKHRYASPPRSPGSAVNGSVTGSSVGAPAHPATSTPGSRTVAGCTPREYRARARSGDRDQSRRGSRTVNTVPSGEVARSMLPECSDTRLCTIDMPRPVPDSLVEKNGS